MTFRTDCLRAAGGFDGAFGTAADVAAWIRCSHSAGGAAFAGQYFCRYREHASSLTAATAIEEWKSRIDGIGRLIVELYGKDTGAEAAAASLSGYMAMDLAAKAAIASGRGVFAAILAASGHAGGDRSGLARISAKAAYYWLRRTALRSEIR
jgi:hypothetical protein